MLVYEKDNKLNISFENNLETPDIEIGKSEINVDGNNIVSGGSGGDSLYIINFVVDVKEGTATTTTSIDDIIEAYDSNKILIARFKDDGDVEYSLSLYSIDEVNSIILFMSPFDKIQYSDEMWQYFSV